MKTRSIVLTAILLLVVAQLCWASNVVLGRALRADIPPVALAWWRWVLAFAILLPFSWKHLKADWRTILASWPAICLLSILGISVFNTLLYLAMKSTTAINGSLIQATIPAIVPIISWAIYRQQVSLIQGVGILTCITGAFLVLLQGNPLAISGLKLAQGDLIMILGVTIYALYSVLLRWRPQIHALSFLATTFGLGALFLMPVYLWEWTTSTQPIVWTPSLALSIVHIAIFPSIIAFYCWNRGVLDLGANYASLFTCLISVFTAILSYLFLSDPLHWYHFAGMGLITAGILVSRKQG